MIGDLIKPESSPPQSYYRRTRRRSLFSRWWVRWGLAFAFVAAVALAVTGLVLKSHYQNKALQYDLSSLSQLERSNMIYGRDGDEIGSFYLMENRRPVAFVDLPKHFIDALVAEEDSRFWEHDGVDYMGILRAIRATLLVRRVHQGASTITQQLARQGFGMANQKTLDRKFTEIFLARRIEREFNKQQILELYLNRIYFGRGFYGVNAAALGYFGRPINDLTLEEGAVLAGLIKAPNRCSPLNDIVAATEARNHVLNRMLAENFIMPADHARYKAMEIKLSPGRVQGVTGYVQTEVREKLIDLLGYEQTVGGGFRVFTTIDSELQKSAERSMKARLAEMEKLAPNSRHESPDQYSRKLEAFLATGKTIDDKDAPRPAYLQGALLAVDNANGAILSLVGGREFSHSQYNRALQSFRPTGTAFLPFVYAAAFENGAYPGTPVKDAPLDNTRVMIGAITGILGEWGSEDSRTGYSGDINARRALVLSRNGSTVRVGADVGLAKVQDFARRAGFQSPLVNENKAFLGHSEATPAEMALAYTSFANGGLRPAQLHLVTRVEDHEGRVVYASKAAEAPPVRATDEFTAYQIHSCLQQALREGPGAEATTKHGLAGIPAAGKGGTHSSFTDLWFAGGTNRVTCAVWVGLDKPSTIFENAFSRQVALPIWCDFIQAAESSFPASPIDPPATGESLEVCTRSGLRATDNCYEAQPDPASGRLRFVRTTYREVVRPGYKVTDSCQFHSKLPDGAPPTSSIAPLAAEPVPIVNPRNTAAASKAETIPILAPVLLGSEDPYQSINSTKAIPRAGEVLDSPPVVSANEPEFDLAPQRLLEKEKGRLDLRPPDPIKLD
ncbi:MAG: transglycosylase domain-containing protein [Verrucomicrobiales bacterium]